MVFFVSLVRSLSMILRICGFMVVSASCSFLYMIFFHPTKAEYISAMKMSLNPKP